MCGVYLGCISSRYIKMEVNKKNSVASQYLSITGYTLSYFIVGCADNHQKIIVSFVIHTASVECFVKRNRI